MKISDLKNYTVTAAPAEVKPKVNGPNQSNPSNPFSPFPDNGGESYGQSVAKDFTAGVSQIKDSFKAPTSGINSFENALKTGAGVVNTALSPVAPILDATLGTGIRKTGEAIGGTKTAQNFVAQYPTIAAGAERMAEDVGNAATIAGAVAGGAKAPKVSSTVTENASRAVDHPPKGPTGPSGLVTSTKSAIRDVIPTTQRWINHHVSLALDLTPGDLNKISRSTGNDVGTFMSDHNLIGTNKPTTQELLNNFFEENYKGVRADIGKVADIYKQYQVPRYVDALKQIQSSVAEVPGLEKTQAEVSNLLTKQDIKLSDVQRVKELLDEHFNLYKDTGEIGAGREKGGLANIRQDIKSFIEGQVKEKTGKDISSQNNNVATAKAISDTMTTREPKGLTRANLTMKDAAAFFFGSSFAGPLGGVAALFVKKIYESPSMRLRIAKKLDSMSDARKAQIKSDLEAGKIDSELIQATK